MKEVMEWLDKEYAADICVLKSIDWIDDKLKVHNNTIHQDLKHIIDSVPTVGIEFI